MTVDKVENRLFKKSREHLQENLTEEEIEVLSTLSFRISRTPYAIAKQLDKPQKEVRQTLIGLEHLEFLQIEEKWTGRQLGRYYTYDPEKAMDYIIELIEK